MKTTSPELTGPVPSRLGRRAAGWFIGVGTVLALLGLVASIDPLLATFATTFMVGVIMAAAGIVQLIHAFAVRRWTWSSIWGLAGLLYLGAAAAAIYDPLAAAALLTLWLAVALGMSGTIRILIAMGDRGHGWGWLLASGIASVAASAMVGWGWPMNALWVLGLVLAIDLLFQGVMLLLMGAALFASDT